MAGRTGASLRDALVEIRPHLGWLPQNAPSRQLHARSVSHAYHSAAAPFRSTPGSTITQIAPGETVGGACMRLPRHRITAPAAAANALSMRASRSASSQPRTHIQGLAFSTMHGSPRFARTISTFTLQHLGITRQMRKPVDLTRGTQQMSLFGGNTSRQSLARMEQTANNNPQSASAQNAFYSALLRAGLPQIVVERFSSGKYASNAACETVYEQAMEMVGQQQGGTSAVNNNAQLDPQQLRAIGQAVAANTAGSSVAMQSGGSGAKASPLYVVVEESRGSLVFRYFKFLFNFALTLWFIWVLMSLLAETTGLFKRGAAAGKAEVRPELQKTRFTDVHGCDEAKDELQELVDFLKNPEKFSKLGGKMPKGVLLVGPPGTGKTLLARAVAGEAGVPFFFMSGSEFDEMYVGVGAKRVRELFNAARAKAPAIVFIDEIDAIGGRRNDRDVAYVRQTLNQLLTELDGFDNNSGVIFLAATNFPKALDKALTRPGRFDRNVTVTLPDVRGRLAILTHYMRNIRVDPAVDPAVLARGTPGFSGADLESIINQAAVHASKNKSPMVGINDLEWAKDKVLMGGERRNLMRQQKDKIATAYHEGGHALVMLLSPYATPLYKATILPRGQALGATFSLPEMDVVSTNKAEYQAQLAVMLGGKVAEELIYGEDHVTSGAASDLSTATKTAMDMVTAFGMSDLVGNVSLYQQYNQLSPESKAKVEQEVRRMIEVAKETARTILTTHRKELDLLAAALVEYETLNKEEIERVIKGEPLLEKPRIAAPIKLPEGLKGLVPDSKSQAGVGIPGADAGSV